jgi:hypothetical protein
MKRYFFPHSGLAIALFALGVSSAYAQKGLHLGARYAPQVTYYLNSDDFDDPERDPGPRFRNSGALLIGYHFSDNIGIGTELTLSGEGVRYVPQKKEPDYDYKTDINLTYFKLPVLFRFNTDPTKRAAFQGFIGPQFSFITGANWRTTETESGKTTVLEYKSFDYKSMTIPPYKENINDPFWVRDVADLIFEESASKGQYKLRELYKSITIGAVLGLGFKIKIVENLYVDGLARLDFHFNDIEAKNKYILKDYGDFDATRNEFTKRGEFDFWDYERTLLKSRRDDRAPSLMFSAGFQIGVTYVLDFSN